MMTPHQIPVSQALTIMAASFAQLEKEVQELREKIKPSEPAFYTTAMLMERFDCSSATITNMVKDGRLPARDTRNGWHRASVENYLKAR